MIYVTIVISLCRLNRVLICFFFKCSQSGNFTNQFLISWGGNFFKKDGVSCGSLMDHNDNSMLDMLIGYSCMQIHIIIIIIMTNILLIVQFCWTNHWAAWLDIATGRDRDWLQDSGTWQRINEGQKDGTFI